MFSTTRVAPPGPVSVWTCTVPGSAAPSGRLWTIALCTRFVVSCSRSAGEPVAGVTSPVVSIVTPRRPASGRSVSVASSARSERSTCSGVKERWSARLSTSSASVRSIARELTECSRSTSSPVAPSGSLRATSRNVWAIASGVRSSWEALAANRRCSATCASSRASMASKESASSRNSSRRPGRRIRCASDPPEARRVASVICASGASMRPARNQPPTRPNTSRNAITSVAAGRNTRGPHPPMNTPGLRSSRRVSIPSRGEYRSRNSHTTASTSVPASMRNPV